MEEFEDPQCITVHPGFNNGCLDPWALRIAAVGLKTKSNRRYTELRDTGQRTEAE